MHGETFVPVRPLADRAWLERDRFLRADRLIDTNTMELAVYGNDADGNVLATLDNLGKGASGAAVHQPQDRRRRDDRPQGPSSWTRHRRCGARWRTMPPPCAC